MGVLRRLSRSVRARRAGGKPGGWQATTAPGINEAPAAVRTPVPERPSRATYPLGLDIGEVANGHHLTVRSIALTDQSLLFDFEFAPGDASGSLWPSMEYGADVSPPGWNATCMDAEEYERPVPQATYAWFDFYRCDYEPIVHSGSENRLNRVARLTFDLKTGQAQIKRSLT